MKVDGCSGDLGCDLSHLGRRTIFDLNSHAPDYVHDCSYSQGRNAAGDSVHIVRSGRMDDLRDSTREFLRQALQSTGWTPYKLAKEAGVSSTTITRPLNNPDWKFMPKIETLAKIASAAKIDLPDAIKATSTMDIVRVRSSIPVLGGVRAGSWEAIPDEPEVEEWLQMDVPEYAGAALFALRVIGRSMDLFYPDGTYVIVAPTAEAGLRIGDHVVVRRYDSSNRAETTLKEVSRRKDGALVLDPKSTDPSHQVPIIMPVASDPNCDVGVEIVGVVVATYRTSPRGRGPLLEL